jgi:hypothetical protein
MEGEEFSKMSTVTRTAFFPRDSVAKENKIASTFPIGKGFLTPGSKINCRRKPLNIFLSP